MLLVLIDSAGSSPCFSPKRSLLTASLLIRTIGSPFPPPYAFKQFLGRTIQGRLPQLLTRFGPRHSRNPALVFFLLRRDGRAFFSYPFRRPSIWIPPLSSLSKPYSSSQPFHVRDSNPDVPLSSQIVFPPPLRKRLFVFFSASFFLFPPPPPPLRALWPPTFV